MRIGVLTGGGDCPGLNPAIRGLVLKSIELGHECVGFRNGWRGLVDGLDRPLTREDVEDIISVGGTMLGSSRTNPFGKGAEHDLAALLANVSRFKLDALVALGGEDTLGVASRLFSSHGVPTVGVPKTMDNDLSETDYTFGFDSAVSVATEAIDRLRDTARSHSRVMVVEVMGRHAGWVALYAGIAGGADWILLPEIPVNMEEMCNHLSAVRAGGKQYSIVVASEGAKLPPRAGSGEPTVDDFDHVSLSHNQVAEVVAAEVEQRTGIETRSVVLGHIQRGGSPSVFDRVLASRLGIKAAELVHAGDFGKMASIQNNQIVAVELKKAVTTLKTVPVELYEEAKVLFKH